MRLRAAVGNHQPDGPVERLVAYLSLHGFTAYDALMIPFHILFGVIMLVTTTDQLKLSPVFRRLLSIAPISAWALLLMLFAVCVLVGIVAEWWLLSRFGYVLMATWWFAYAGLIFVSLRTVLFTIVYVLIGIVCLYRQAEVAVIAEAEAKRGRE